MASTYLVPILVLLCLNLFGLLYDMHISKEEARGVEGETWLWVVIGVGVTVFAGGAIIGGINMLWMFGLFASSGIWMIRGAKVRHNKKMKRFTKRFTDENAEQTPPTR